ncbi:hypothetical protein BDQ94DRAFT_140118 [Aspergillus welwitschiae]|uniref:Uncharacterized protein n=1 Tax=Aspergillus welwitschiae TaxID=1341132 RepID=A0A3F3Q777_9EURO|nr:hypothetical protein BDQ94DRAFT_140118 [Aspergillus welwitschiae]RDH35028.1 hypothetical protein BDQ94DRAFT_140118 [Aspergillus welwitschiae]
MEMDLSSWELKFWQVALLGTRPQGSRVDWLQPGPFFFGCPFFLFPFSVVIYLTLITEYYLLILLIFNRHFLFLFCSFGCGSSSAYYFSRSVGSGPGSSRPSGTLAWDTNWTILQSFRYAGYMAPVLANCVKAPLRHEAIRRPQSNGTPSFALSG